MPTVSSLEVIKTALITPWVTINYVQVYTFTTQINLASFWKSWGPLTTYNETNQPSEKDCVGSIPTP